MIEVLVKGIKLRGRIGTIADKYDDSGCDMPSHDDVMGVYISTNRFLSEHAETEKILPEQINPFPLVQEGVIGIPAGANFYNWKDFLIANLYMPSGGIFYGGVLYSVWAAGRCKNEEIIDGILRDIKWKGNGAHTILGRYILDSDWDEIDSRRVYVKSWGRGQIDENLTRLLLTYP